MENKNDLIEMIRKNSLILSEDKAEINAFNQTYYLPPLREPPKKGLEKQLRSDPF